MTRKLSKQEWVDLISEFERQGMTHEEFVAFHDLNISTFRSWLYKIRNGEASPSREISIADVEFVEVKGASSVDSHFVRIQMSMMTIELQSLPPARWIAELIRESSGIISC